MQHCNRIYYSTVHWRLNMFRAAYRSSSGALTLFAASGLHTHMVTGCSQVWLDYGRSPYAYVNQRLQIQLELLMMSGMPLETCWAFNERWNNKLYYRVAYCWLFLLSHTTMHGFMKLYESCVLYIGRAYRYPPDVVFYVFFSAIISTEYFKRAADSLFFSSKCRLFHNATFFGSCIIHILHTGCAKI
jgi:hypothetical protein